MATNNVVNAPFPLSATQGGLGVADPTAHGVLIAEGASAATPIVLGAGQVLIGTTASDPVAATLTAGTGIGISSVSGAITITATSSVQKWLSVSGTSSTLTADEGYIANNVALTTFTLPATAAVGDEFRIVGTTSGGWTIAQNAGQSIRCGTVTSTTGVGGSVASSAQGETVHLLCTVANTGFQVIDFIGNLFIT